MSRQRELPDSGDGHIAEAAGAAAGSVNFAAGAAPEAFDSSGEGTFTVSGSTFPAVVLASKLPFELPDRAPTTFASDELGLMSAAAPSSNSALTLETVQTVYRNQATTVLSNGGNVTPDAAAFLAAHKMTTLSFLEATATQPESGISVLSASEEATPASAGEVATLGDKEALPEGE